MERERELLFERWHALRNACYVAHSAGMEGRAGGAVMCICGCNCGGHAACAMLGIIRDFIHYADVGRMRAADRRWIEEMRCIV